MRAACVVEFKNRRRIVALVGSPPCIVDGAPTPDFDVVCLRFQDRPRPHPGDLRIYLAPEEAAWVITVMSQALKKLLDGERGHFAKKYRRSR